MSGPWMDLAQGMGRTKAMVEKLPEGGCTVVVHNREMVDYIRRMVVDLRGQKVSSRTRVIVVVSMKDYDKLCSSERRVFVDHAWSQNVAGDIYTAVMELVDAPRYDRRHTYAGPRAAKRT